ncbi:transaldolase family protein [Bacteroidota bacterium]
MKSISDALVQDIHEFIHRDINHEPGLVKSDKTIFWHSLKETGTELWLDTGDMVQAERIWTSEMTALTTNNSLLNFEIQKGIYDDYIEEANGVLKDLEIDQKVIEIAFILNARHGLRLVQRFGGKLSIELHTDFAHDMEGILSYGKRFHEINPEHFIVKVPYTATGLLGARKLQNSGVHVNLTLGFSARQNALITAVTKPDYLNVFLGRLSAYVFDNNLGDGYLIGEKATLASQRIVRKLSDENEKPTMQIAASMRCAEQIGNLAGVDVFAMPVKVAWEARENFPPRFTDRTSKDYEIKLARDVDPEDVKAYNLWYTSDEELKLARYLDDNLPVSGTELELVARSMGCKDMFPVLSKDDQAHIALDGKIPIHERWKDRIRNGELAIDTLLNLAGLASFAADQEALDNRIRKIIS